MYERILVPLDGSSLAEQVFPCVAELAKAFDSEVILVGICEPEESESGLACRIYIDYSAERLRPRVKDSAAKFETAVLTGKADSQILQYGDEKSVSLIIMASHGRSGIAPWSLGGTVQKVLHQVGVPIIIVRAREKAEESGEIGIFKRILVPLDGSERGEKTLPYVAELAKRLGSELILLRVIESGRHIHSTRGLEYVPFKDQDLESMKQSAQEYLAGVSSRLAETKASVRFEVSSGDSAREIIQFAEKRDCPLIAIASHGHSGLEAWIYGSVTYKVLQSSSKSVLLVPSLSQ